MTAGVPGDKQLQHKTAFLKCSDVTLPLIAPLSYISETHSGKKTPVERIFLQALGQ